MNFFNMPSMVYIRDTKDNSSVLREKHPIPNDSCPFPP